MKKIFLWMAVVAFTSCFSSCNCDKGAVSSPNGLIVLNFNVGEDGSIYYNVSRGDSVILNDSQLGFKLKESDFYDDFNVVDMRFATLDECWNPIWGEESVIRNNYNEMLVSLQERSGEMRRLDIRFRIFDDGYGFRYEFPEQEQLGDFTIMEELTEFAFADDNLGWSIPMDGCRFYEGLFTRKPASEMGWVTTPVTFEGKNGLFMTVHEANLTDYAAMNLNSVGESGVMRAKLTPLSTGECVRVTDTRVTPWRTMIIAESAGDLILSRLMLNLNEPCAIEDTSWIKPMRYIGVWWSYHMHKNTWYDGPKHGATTENVMRYMDFAAKNGFGGVLVEGWNEGWRDYDFSFTKPYADFDIKKITDYGREIGVELIGHHETGANVSNYEAQMEDGFKLYNKYGVSNVKTGYVGDLLDGKERHSSQYGVNHYRKVIETAAKYHINIDNHEPVIPTGLQRTYPNLMTQEGVRGQEWDAWSPDGGNPPSHTTILPFTRGLAGPMDFTPVTFNFVDNVVKGTRVHTTIAKQLALFVVLYSPLQMASDEIENYIANPQPLSFVKTSPTDWDKTVVPEAVIGEYVTIARKGKGSDNWYIGSITNECERVAKIDLSFLDEGVEYMAYIYRDGDKADYNLNPTDIVMEQKQVDSDTTLEVKQVSGGGTAIRIEPIN